MLGLGQLRFAVNAQGLFVIPAGKHQHRLVHLLDEGQRIGQVKFVLGALRHQLRKRRLQRFGVKNIHAAVDFSDFFGVFVGVGVFYNVFKRAVRRADNAAVARRIRHRYAQYKRAGFAAFKHLGHFGQRLGL